MSDGPAILEFVDAAGKPTGRVALYYLGKVIEPARNVPPGALGWSTIQTTDEIHDAWLGKTLSDLAALKAFALTSG